MNDLAASLKKILDAEGIETHILVGHSMGGYVAMAKAYRAYSKEIGRFVSIQDKLKANPRVDLLLPAPQFTGAGPASMPWHRRG